MRPLRLTDTTETKVKWINTTNHQGSDLSVTRLRLKDWVVTRSRLKWLSTWYSLTSRSWIVVIIWWKNKPLPSHTLNLVWHLAAPSRTCRLLKIWRDHLLKVETSDPENTMFMVEAWTMPVVRPVNVLDPTSIGKGPMQCLGRRPVRNTDHYCPSLHPYSYNCFWSVETLFFIFEEFFEKKKLTHHHPALCNAPPQWLRMRHQSHQSHPPKSPKSTVAGGDHPFFVSPRCL